MATRLRPLGGCPSRGRRWRRSGRRGCRRRCGPSTPRASTRCSRRAGPSTARAGDRGVADVVGVQHALAVALDQHVVDDDRRLPRGPGQAASPSSSARSPVDAASSRPSLGDVDHAVVEGRRGPEPAGVVTSRSSTDHTSGSSGLRGSSFMIWPTSWLRALPRSYSDADVEEALLVDDDGGVGVVAGPEAEDRVGRRAVREAADVPALDQAAASWRSRRCCRDGDGVLDRDAACRRCR